ncbi:phosphatidylinositol-specific phospholipase C/glycerophosphodiester phosphodiesterase family protein [Mucilaginibacter sp. AW1-3]
MLVFLNAGAQNPPLTNAFAHNDYWHKRPLFDALDNGFTHLEADVYLRDGKLIVAHFFPFLKKKRTLEQLYLDPLSTRIQQNKLIGSSYPVTLLIDIKSDAESTYQALQLLLQKYRPLLTSYQDGVIIQRQLTIVLSGHKPYNLLAAQHYRLAFIDEDLRKVKRDTVANLCLMASCRYSHFLTWNGDGEMPVKERNRLCSFVKAAHLYGKKVRLWASPENKTVWKELLNCGVDLINTDQLAKLRTFLLDNATKYANVEKPQASHLSLPAYDPDSEKE